jgi:guanine deaminase
METLPPDRIADAPGRAVRGTVLHFLDDPGPGEGAPAAYEVFDDGLLVIRGGRVAALGDARRALARLDPAIPVSDCSGCLIVPGFVDTHVHYAQTDIIASCGSTLMQWLERYAFPAERRFHDRAHAHEVAGFFLDELLRNGTTTAMVLGTVHPESVDAIFEAAQARHLRLVAGKVLMDRNCPEELRDTPQTAYADSKALIGRWHGCDRLQYAVTPRFAPTSSDAQLAAAGRLLQEHPDVLLQTHLAENRDEVAWVAGLFPGSRSYLDIYDRHGLLRPGAVLAHCLHLDDADRERIADSGASIAFCPTSNLFLGSGLFDYEGARTRGIRVGIGTDVGGGTSFSLLRTLSEGYKALQLAHQQLSPLQAFYLATLGGARALRQEARIGNFLPGREADFVVLDPQATPLLQRRLRRAGSLAENLSAFLVLGDDRCVAATYVLGRCAYRRDGLQPGFLTGEAPERRGD